MKKTLLMAAVVAGVSMFAGVAPASAWTLLGQKSVSDRAEVDNIYLPGNARYKRIKICVARNPVRFYDVDVFYHNGGHQDFRIRQRINPGECTRVLDLNGWRRNINRIRFAYEETSRGRRRSGTVLVYGDN